MDRLDFILDALTMFPGIRESPMSIEMLVGPQGFEPWTKGL